MDQGDAVIVKWTVRIVGVLVAALAVLFLVFRTPDTDPAQMRAKYAGEPSQFVEIGGGVKVHLRDEGPRDGLPVILLHGSNADLHTWEPWVEGLKDTYRVIRFDQIGHGLTGPNTAGDHSLDSFLADIDEVADALKLDRFVLGGNSMGGSHTVGYAIRHPERVLGIVLVDAGGAPIIDKAKGNTGFSIARTPGLNQIMRYITPRALVEKSLRQSVSNEAIVTDAAVDRYWEMLRYPGNRTATIERFSRGWAGYTEEQVKRIEVPALVMWGDQDGLIPVSAGEWYARLLPQNQFKVYKGIGHLPHEEAAAATLIDLRAWLSSLDSARKGTESQD